MLSLHKKSTLLFFFILYFVPVGFTGRCEVELMWKANPEKFNAVRTSDLEAVIPSAEF